MPKTILLTSFTTWKPEQSSNSSDDLLELLQQEPYPADWQMLRLLPVDFELAPQRVIAQFEQLQPEVVICCGMAEKRDRLNLEARAVLEDSILYTPVNLDRLLPDLGCTDISEDAGQFVCNTLYHAMLQHLQAHYRDRLCLFVHVPVLTPENTQSILIDFRAILAAVASQ
jgi:pyroglutamyl-peptidase